MLQKDENIATERFSRSCFLCKCIVFLSNFWLRVTRLSSLGGLSLSKQPVSHRPPLPAPACLPVGNLLLVFKEQRSHRGGMGEVCATDSGAGAGQWAVLSPFTNQCQTTAPGLLPAACSSHIHGGVETHSSHAYPRGTPLMVTMGSHSPVKNTDCIWHTHYRWLFHTLRFQWQLMFLIGVKWTDGRGAMLTACCDHHDLIWAQASIIHALFNFEVKTGFNNFDLDTSSYDVKLFFSFFAGHDIWRKLQYI